MSQDFKDRLARLEAKHGSRPPPPPPPTIRTTGPAHPRGPGGGGNGGHLKFIIIGLLVIVGLPTAAFVGTMLYERNKTAVADVAHGLKLLNIAHGPAGQDVERKRARADMNGIAIRLGTGTMTQEEGAYWNTPEGKKRLVESARKSINLDGLEAAARERYKVD